MPKTAVIIPARLGSTRLRNKPLHLIAGRPLIQHVWERCSRAKGIETVIIATDAMEIAEVAFEFGAEVAMTSLKHRSGTDRVAEVAEGLRGVAQVINVQGDEPLVDPKLITKMAKTMAENREIQMITAASLLTKEEEVANPNVVKVVLDRAKCALYFSRSPIPFVRGEGVPMLRHHGIYGYTRKFLLNLVTWKPSPLEKAESLEQLRVLENGAKIRVIMTTQPAASVDTLEDVKQVERLLGLSKSGSEAPRKTRRSTGKKAAL